MADEYFVGLRGTSDLATNERPENWRPGIMRLFPNGQAPLTALTAMMKSSTTDDIHFHWWTKTFNGQRAAVTGIYTDSALSSAYVSGGVAGTVLYVKMAAADIAFFRAGHQVLLRVSTAYSVDVNAKVLSVTANGDSSYAVCRLLEADDKGGTTYLGSCDTIKIIGSINPQGGKRPTAITQSPSEFSNYTQIFRDSVDISRTLAKTRTRTGNPLIEAKRDALEQHSVGMENAFLWGIQSSGTGDNGKPESTTDGIVTQIRYYGTVQDFTIDTGSAFAGKTWLEVGDQWIDEHLEEIFRYGSSERLAFVGSGALLGIQRLVKELGFYQINDRTTSFGMAVQEWKTPFGMLTMKTHPLFSYEVTNRHSMVIFEPANIEYRYITDTRYAKDPGNDADVEETGDYLTEAGLEVHFPVTCGYLNGVGKDNTV